MIRISRVFVFDNIDKYLLLGGIDFIIDFIFHLEEAFRSECEPMPFGGISCVNHSGGTVMKSLCSSGILVIFLVDNRCVVSGGVSMKTDAEVGVCCRE